MDSARVLPFLTLISLVLPVCIRATDQSITSVLSQYGLPVGLLPDAVKSYTLSDDGKFEVELEKNCYVHFSYLVYYSKKITGKLSYGKISDLSGVEAKEFFIWVDVTGIEVDRSSSKYIYFKVGFISKKLDISEFESVRECKDSLTKRPCGDKQPGESPIDVQ
eukprot:TRINITY_DN5687_c0_g1_i2.p1 TRINITY_DN5687_c0_g1~~TRINITY_DN5687_c0_g1_i2.p1  ORF type:complete len:163 (-),score=9.71 TRINITY_DN5687_c0_g1_i2:238-726(-)